MLSFTKPTSDQDGEAKAPAAETAPEGSAPAADSASPEVRPLFAKAEKTSTPTPVDAADEPAMRSQIQRVRLDLLSRETERLEQQLRQVLEQQNEDRQLREELRGQIANLNQRIESLLVSGAATSAESGGADSDMKTAVKPMLQAVLRMLDSTGAVDPAQPSSSAGSSEPGAQVDAARRQQVPSTTPPSVAEIAVKQMQETAARSEAHTAGAESTAGKPDTLDSPEPNLPEAEAAPATAADPEDDLDLDPEAELRVEIARLLRPKKAGGGYEPLGSQAKAAAERAEAGSEPARSSPAAALGTEPGPLLLGTDETPEVDNVPPSRPSRQGDGLGRVADGRNKPSGGRKADSAQGDLRGGGAAPKGQRPSWAPRPNPMRASLPKCLTEPWEEPSNRPGGRWPFRRTRSAGGRNDPTE